MSDLSGYIDAEHRADRHPSDPSTVIAANGSLIRSSDTEFVLAALRLTLAERAPLSEPS